MRVYRNTKAGITHTDNPDVVELNLAELSACLAEGATWASTPEMRQDPSLFVLRKYDEMRRKIEQEGEIEMPWVYSRNGRLNIMDGRHRLYAMIDLGYTHVLVVTDRGEGDQVRRFVEAAVQGRDQGQSR